jgi:hypothetical protein
MRACTLVQSPRRAMELPKHMLIMLRVIVCKNFARGKIDIERTEML